MTAVLEFGLDENYLMILYDNNPIITDIFLRGQDRKILLNLKMLKKKKHWLEDMLHKLNKLFKILKQNMKKE